MFTVKIRNIFDMSSNRELFLSLSLSLLFLSPLPLPATDVCIDLKATVCNAQNCNPPSFDNVHIVFLSLASSSLSSHHSATQYVREERRNGLLQFSKQTRFEVMRSINGYDANETMREFYRAVEEGMGVGVGGEGESRVWVCWTLVHKLICCV